MLRFRYEVALLCNIWRSEVERTSMRIRTILALVGVVAVGALVALGLSLTSDDGDVVSLPVSYETADTALPADAVEQGIDVPRPAAVYAPAVEATDGLPPYLEESMFTADSLDAPERIVAQLPQAAPGGALPYPSPAPGPVVPRATTPAPTSTAPTTTAPPALSTDGLELKYLLADQSGFAPLAGASVEGELEIVLEVAGGAPSVVEVCFFVDGDLNRCDGTSGPFEVYPRPSIAGATVVTAKAITANGDELVVGAGVNGADTPAPTVPAAPATPAPAPTTPAPTPTAPTAPPPQSTDPTPTVGTTGGGAIGASNTGLTGAVNAGLMTQAQRNSMANSGSIHSEYDGQVIEFVRVTGSIIINHRNVTVRFCEVIGGSIGTGGNQYDRDRNLRVEWCDIHGSNGGSVIGDASFTAHRNHIWDVGRGINASLGRVVVTENYLHSFRQLGGADPHTSAIGDSGNGWENAYVARNKVLPHDVSTPSGLSGAIVNYYRPGQSSPGNTSIIEDNYLGGGSYAMYAWGPNTVARNNVFAILNGGGYDGDAGFYGALNLGEGASGSGNKYSNGDPL